MSAVVLRGDARSLPLPDGSVDLICTSPPYFGQRSYTDNVECLDCISMRYEGRDPRQAWPDYQQHILDVHRQHYDGQIGSEATPAEFIGALLNCAREWIRVLKPSGSLFVNLGDKYANGGQIANLNSGPHLSCSPAATRDVARGFQVKSLLGLPWRFALACTDQLGLILRAEIVWAKPNGLPDPVTDRVCRAHEQVFHFTARPQYYSAVDEIREDYSDRVQDRQRYARRDIPASRGYAPQNRKDSDRARGILGFGADGANPLGKLPGSVWDIPSQPLVVPAHLGIDHFAAFPMGLPKRCVLGWSPADGIVLDPFGGTGTTALVADMLGRTGISVDRSADYCRLARWRTTDPAERARALGVPKPPPVPEGQAALFGMDEAS